MSTNTNVDTSTSTDSNRNTNSSMSTIMIVDDETMITKTLSTLLRVIGKFNVIEYNSSTEAIKALEHLHVDMVISDFLMPEMNGLEFLRKVRVKDEEIVLMLLTGYADKENAIKSINEVGIYYYLEKPWENKSLLKIVTNGIEKKNLASQIKRNVVDLEASNEKIIRLYDLLKTDYQTEVENVKNLVVSLANVIEAKDAYTDGHIRRVGNISAALGKKLGLDENEVEVLRISGLIHDIGKVGIPEAVLNKPGKLNVEEFEAIKKHSEIGENICGALNSMKKYLDPIRHHHEKLNGSGYPDGLRGDEISINARIVAVADIFDALFSDRPYRGKLPLEKVKEILYAEVQDNHLDPKVVEGLFEIMNDIKEIY